MLVPFPSSIPARAWVVLAAALASAAGLVAVALHSLGDPALAGQAELARLAGSVADGVVAEWERLRRDPAPFADGEPLVFAAELPPQRTPPPELPRAPNPVVDALLAEANRLERAEHAPERALEVLAAALEKPVDAERRGELLLRTIQVASALGDAERARAAWRSTLELAPDVARSGTSLALLATLAAAPRLAPEERTEARARLAAAWAAGELALPDEPLPGDPALLAAALREPAPLAAELRRRLQALVPGSEDPQLAHTALAERTRALATAFGPLPAPEDEPARLATGPVGELLYRRAADGTLEGVPWPPGEALRRLAAALERNELLPPDFALDLGALDASSGPVVRAPTPLTGSPLAFALRHADPARVTEALGRRQAWTRAALLVLALFTAAAGLSTFRALVRERRLATLRAAFVASVSHELRTPIASILLLAENLERGRVAGEEARTRYHGLIRREAERLRVLVDDVLDVARLERGERAPGRLEPMQAAALVDELEQAARERVAAAGGTLEATRAGLPPHVHADREALRRALLNLVENALRHSGSTDLDLATVGDGAGGLVIRLRDHGRGIPSAARARIFEPFERLALPGSAPGTGLGLAIVREVAERHGGRAVALAPEQGPGAVFEIHLPRRREEDA
ncbi:MAG TPA: HAMP domain-containing sensor histidine kinase [Planctomycetota bacterium]